MMFSRFLVVGLASLALACGIALICYKILGPSDNRKKVQMRSVVVATAELPVGARIRTQDIRVVNVPEELAPQKCLDKMDEVKDRVVTSLILKDEPVVSSRLAPPGSAPGLAPMIPAGYRAVSVRVNDVIGVAGFIQPGMRVDVLASGRLPNSDDSVTRTVLQNVAVLSAGQVLQPEPKGQVINAQVVTLQVRPDEAEILALTSGEGRIQLILRNSSDTAVVPTPGAHLTAIYNKGGESPVTKVLHPVANRHLEQPLPAPPKLSAPSTPAVPPPVQKQTVEVIRGTTRSDVSTPAKTETKSEAEKSKVTGRFYAKYTFA
jgi:pilus assembly protein CpaB